VAHGERGQYALRGCVWCGLCGRRMQRHRVRGTAYYRCRLAAEYALANHVEHPLSINLREDAVIGRVDRWLVREFAPHRLHQTISDLAAAQPAESATPVDDHGEAVLTIAECDRKLAQYRAALDAGGRGPDRQVRDLPAAGPQADVPPGQANHGGAGRTADCGFFESVRGPRPTNWVCRSRADQDVQARQCPVMCCRLIAGRIID
jgi:hypothetical protein